MAETRKDRYRRELLELLPEDRRQQGEGLIQAYEVAFCENVYCSWCGDLVPIGPADSHETLREEMRRHALACQKHPLHEELTRYKKWVDDLLSGMTVNCVYCGHRYGPNPGTPVAMADVLKKHVERCPKHPMSLLKKRLEMAERAIWSVFEMQATDSSHPGRTWIRDEALAQVGEYVVTHMSPAPRTENPS